MRKKPSSLDVGSLLTEQIELIKKLWMWTVGRSQKVQLFRINYKIAFSHFMNKKEKQ